MSEKCRKSVFLPSITELENHTSKGKKRRKRKSQEERSEKEKSNGALLAFIMASLEIVLAEKNCVGEEVYLAVKNVFKNPARALLYQIIVSQSRPKYPWRKK